MPSSKNYAWAAGLFEGEGCLTTNNKRGLCASINMTDEDTVRKFHAIMGVGNVYGPYRGQTGSKDKSYHKSFWQWRAAKFEHVQYLIAAFWDFFSERRKARATELLKMKEEHRALI